MAYGITMGAKAGAITANTNPTNDEDIVFIISALPKFLAITLETCTGSGAKNLR